MNFLDKHPPLYQCSVCLKPVSIKVIEGQEPLKEFICEHAEATIWANRSVILRGKGRMNFQSEMTYKLKVKVKQLLSALFGRSF